MIVQLEALIKAQDYESAALVIPLLKNLFHEKNEIMITLDELSMMLIDHSPDAYKKLNDLKYLVIG